MARVDPPLRKAALLGLGVAVVAVATACTGRVCTNCITLSVPTPSDVGYSIEANDWRRFPSRYSNQDEVDLDRSSALMLRFSLPDASFKRAVLILYGSAASTERGPRAFRVGLASSSEPSLERVLAARTQAPTFIVERFVRPGGPIAFELTEIAGQSNALGRNVLDVVVRSQGPVRLATPRTVDPALRPRLELLTATPRADTPSSNDSKPPTSAGPADDGEVSDE